MGARDFLVELRKKDSLLLPDTCRLVSLFPRALLAHGLWSGLVADCCSEAHDEIDALVGHDSRVGLYLIGRTAFPCRAAGASILDGRARIAGEVSKFRAKWLVSNSPASR